MKHVTNVVLMAFFLGLLVLPVVGVGSLVSLSDFEGFVAGANTVTGEDVNIIPNVQNFNGYVEFAPSEIADGVYRDEVGVTSFQRQRATYRGLYTVYNVSDNKTVSLQLISTGLTGASDAYESLIVSLGDGDYTNALATDVAAGSAVIPVNNTSYYGVGDYVYLGTELAQVVEIGAQELVVEPLKQDHVVGETVYPQSIVVTADALVHPQTQSFILGPGERVQVHVVVQGTASLLKQDQMLHLPLEFRLTEVE
ncbi:hypothetical protein KC614_00840 [candidate division WWE3 bacterium]|uniref:Uncharacterized protein n=1 Tax=candidate division WWE3 bacterium TaxID=2053526 RepID=A0A955RQK8_UNCKA|nr:hypothetical protein [candidate division WWE3 bacterium]